MIIISTVRNEEKYLPETISSVISQTVKPWKWLIVDDGSTDSTFEIAKKSSYFNSWMEVIHIENRGQIKFIGTDVEGFRYGLSHIKDVNYDFICKLDGDLSLPPMYVEKILQKFIENPALGIAGGRWLEPNKGNFKRVRTLPEFPFGGARVWRRQCLIDIGPLFTSSGWDRLDCFSAMMHGWVTEVFNDPEIDSLHQRQMASLGGSKRKQYGRDGISSYYQGDHPIYVLASSIYKMTERPYILAGMSRLLGYLTAWITRAPQCNDKQLIHYLRSWQMRKIKHILYKKLLFISN